MGVRAALALAASAASAEPGYLAAPDHALTVREAPGGAALGALAPGLSPVEITGLDETGLWGRVIFGERDGWVALDALTPAEPPRLADSAIPSGLVCAGTEPFWSLTLSNEAIVYSAPGAEPEDFGLMDVRPAEGFARWPSRLTLYGEARSGVAILRPLACSDGMSDRTHAWTLDFLIQEEGALRLRSGCCRLPPSE
jgi:uncharacterized membrane protein